MVALFLVLDSAKVVAASSREESKKDPICVVERKNSAHSLSFARLQRASCSLGKIRIKKDEGFDKIY